MLLCRCRSGDDQKRLLQDARNKYAELVGKEKNFTQEITSVIEAYVSLSLRVCLHKLSASTLRQLCDDGSNSVLIENNGVAQDWGCNFTLWL